MKPLAIVLGTLAGALGAAVWAAITYYANYEIGYIAWGIGGLVGFAVAYGNQGGSAVAGVGAALITTIALLAGKYAAVELSLQQVLAGPGPEAYTDENLISYLADAVVEQRETAGKPVQWPHGVDSDDAWTESDYPKDVWAEATAKWRAMSPDEQAAFRQSTIDSANADISDALGEIRQAGFLASFGFLDIVFFGLGIATAFGIANNAESM